MISYTLPVNSTQLLIFGYFTVVPEVLISSKDCCKS